MRRRHRSPVGWSAAPRAALVVAAMALVGIVTWASFGDVPFVSVPRDLFGCERSSAAPPRFLDEGEPAVSRAVEAAQSSACEEREARFYEALGAALAARYAEADADELAPWNRMTSFQSDEAQDLWRDGRRVDILSFDPWPVPETPTWSEDPYGDLSWLRTYHSLGWLNAPAEAYERSGDPRFAHEVGRYVMSWIRGNPPDDSPSRRSWFDGAVALRTDALVAHLDLLLEILDPSELEEVLRSLDLHGRTLNRYLSDERWYGHNHNLFHALSLHNLATQVPELRRADQWRENARDRIRTLLGEMVDADGVSTEQAAGYHYTAVRWFSMAERYLSERGLALSEEELRRLTEMSRFGALLPSPHDEVPAIGDTRYGAGVPWSLLEDLDHRDRAHPEAEFILSRGARGSRPNDLTVFPASGYSIMRPSYGDAGRWENDLHVVVDMGPYRTVHGHRDAMNVLLSSHGASLLVDSGGPFAYGIPRRGDYLHAAAHNTVVVDGRDHPDEGVPIVTRTVDEADFSLVEGWHAPADGVRHTRAVVLLKPDLVLVVDWLQSTGGSHTYELLYHVNPASDIAPSDDGMTATVGRASLAIVVETSEDEPRLGTRFGEPGSPVGWVTIGHRREREAPVLSVEQQGTDAWFVTALRPAAAEEAGAVTLEAESDGAVIEVRVDGRGGEWQLRLGPGDAPVVTRPR